MSFESYFLSSDWFVEMDADNLHKVDVDFSPQLDSELSTAERAS